MESTDELPPSYEHISCSYYEPNESTLHRHHLFLLITISILASYQHNGTQWGLFSCSGSVTKMLRFPPCVLHTPCHDPLKSVFYSALQNEHQVYIARILHYSFSCAFAALRKGITSFVMSVCPFVRPSNRPPAWNISEVCSLWLRGNILPSEFNSCYFHWQTEVYAPKPSLSLAWPWEQFSQ